MIHPVSGAATQMNSAACPPPMCKRGMTEVIQRKSFMEKKKTKKKKKNSTKKLTNGKNKKNASI